jgi:hypothetical protein
MDTSTPRSEERLEESEMKNQIRAAVAALFLSFAGFGVTAAATTPKDGLFLTYAEQHHLFLNAAQEHALFQSVRKQQGKKVAVPSGFKAEIGQAVPKSVKLHRLPRNATNQVWAAKPYDYVMLQDQLLIVRPQDRKVVDIITQ